MAEIVGIEITKPLPETAVVDSIYKIEGSVKLLDVVGAPPFVYAKVRRKEWYKPEVAEEVSYERGWPVPGTGDFSIEFNPEKEGEYKVSIVATPAPLALPVVGVFPILAESDAMEVAVGEKPPAVFRFSGVNIDGNSVPLTNHDTDSGLLIQKTTADSLEIVPAFEWVGPKKSATISIKAGYRDWAGNFTPKTDAYTRTVELPESPDVPYSGTVEEPIIIPLTACSDVGDGAIEIVAKLPGMADYITQIWNVYATKPPVVAFRFAAITIDGNEVPLTNHDADSGLLLEKTTADHLDVTPVFEWQGPRKTAKISIKAGYKDWMGAFSPKTGAYTRTIELPESLETMYPGQLTSPITVPLTAAGGLTDGAIEVVLKIADMPDYITHIWNVYATGAPPEEADIKDFDFKLTKGTYDIGARVLFTAPYDYKGIAQDGQLTISLGTGVAPSFLTKHTFSPVSVKFEEATDWETRGLEGSIVLPAILEPGQMYSVRAKLETLEKKTQETDTDWSVFDIKEVAPPTSDIGPLDRFAVDKGTYDLGDTVPWSLPYTYKGKAQSGWLTISLGTGPVGTFFTKHTFPRIPVSFEEAYDWTEFYESGEFTLPATLEPGQTYSVRAKLETADGKQETDTDWGVITITEPSVVPPDADIRNVDFVTTKGTYEIGDYVPFSLSYEYKGKAQNGRLVLSLGTGVYPSFFTVQTYNPMAITFAESVDWVKKTISSTFVLTAALEPGKTYNTRAKLETLEDLTQETDTDWGVITIAAVPVGISFQVGIWGIPDFGSYEKWWAYYWDPGINDFVDCGKWYYSYQKISFSNVQSGGYLAVYLKRNTIVSLQYTSPTFQAVDGGVYQYDVQLGRVSKIG